MTMISLVFCRCRRRSSSFQKQSFPQKEEFAIAGDDSGLYAAPSRILFWSVAIVSVALAIVVNVKIHALRCFAFLSLGALPPAAVVALPPSEFSKVCSRRRGSCCFRALEVKSLFSCLFPTFLWYFLLLFKVFFQQFWSSFCLDFLSLPPLSTAVFSLKVLRVLQRVLGSSFVHCFFSFLRDLHLG